MSQCYRFTVSRDFGAVRLFYGVTDSEFHGARRVVQFSTETVSPCYGFTVSQDCRWTV